MKKFSYNFILLILTFIVLFSGCTAPSLPIDNNIKAILLDNNIEKSYIQSINHDSIRNCLDSDFNTNDSLSRVSDYIDEVIETDFDYYKSEHPLIDNNDIAVVDCYIYDNNNQCIYEDKNIKIFIGFNCFDRFIENALFQKQIGDIITISSNKCSNEFLTNYVDSNIKFIISDIKYITIKTGSEVLSENNFQTISQYYEYLYNMKVNEVKLENANQLKECFYEKAIKECVYDLNYNEVKDYSFDIVKDYETSYSAFGMTLEEYYNGMLGLTEEEFFNQCVEEAIYEIKKYLLVGAISAYYNLTPTESELNEYFKTNNISENDKKYACFTYLENTIIQLYSNNEQGL